MLNVGNLGHYVIRNISLPGLRSEVQIDSKRFELDLCPNDERQQEQRSRTEHSQVTCRFECSPEDTVLTLKALITIAADGITMKSALHFP